MASTTSELELQDGIGPHSAIASPVNNPTPTPASAEFEGGVEQQVLPPTDQGPAAWLVLAGCAIIQMPVWGLPLCFGVLQEYYTTHEPFLGKDGSIATVGTTANGILYLSAPVTFTLLTRYPRTRRYCGYIGLAINIAGLLLSSFATHVWHLIATQGILCAIGCGLLYSPTTIYLDEWFVRRKGLAYGIMGGAKSLGGAVLPFILSASLERYGFRTTARGWAVVSLILAVPLFAVMKPRLPLPRTTTARPLNLSFLKLTSFWMLQAGNIIQSFGYSLPSTYMSTYATSIGLSTVIGTLMLSILNAASVVGSVVIGMLDDHMHVSNAILISAFGSALAVLLFWGLSSQVALLAVFVISYGFFAGGFSSTWSGVLNELKAEEPSLETGFGYGLLAGGRGVGLVASGPLSAALIKARLDSGVQSWGYSTEYGPMILFTGVTALLGGWGWMSRVMKIHG